MVIINAALLQDAWTLHPEAESPLRRWIEITTIAQWANFRQLRETFSSADQLDLGTLIVTIFNIKGNSYRLITRISYAQQQVVVRAFLTHAEYDKEKWKK